MTWAQWIDLLKPVTEAQLDDLRVWMRDAHPRDLVEVLRLVYAAGVEAGR